MRTARRPVGLVALSAPALAIALGGCASMSGLDGSSSYACKAPEGVTCDSVSGTYANALQNNLPSQRRRTPPPATTGTAALPAPTAFAAATMTEGLPPTSVSLRSAPRILRLWFKPWEDADHDLYDQGYVYVQVDAGRWQIEHVQRQIREAYAPLKPPPRTAAADAKESSALPTNLKSLPRPLDSAFPGVPTPVVPTPRGSDGSD